MTRSFYHTDLYKMQYFTIFQDKLHSNLFEKGLSEEIHLNEEFGNIAATFSLRLIGHPLSYLTLHTPTDSRY